jgi:hypothetical protein
MLLPNSVTRLKNAAMPLHKANCLALHAAIAPVIPLRNGGRLTTSALTQLLQLSSVSLGLLRPLRKQP